MSQLLAFHVTTFEQSLVTPFGYVISGLTGGLLGYLAQRRSSRDTIAAQKDTLKATLSSQVDLATLNAKAERERARDERLWNRKADLYLDLLEAVAEARLKVGVLDLAIKYPPEDGIVAANYTDPVDRCFARFQQLNKSVSAFAAEPVYTKFAVLHGMLNVMTSPFSATGTATHEDCVNFERRSLAIEDTIRDDFQK